MKREMLIEAFERSFGIGGTIRTFFAPGRINLIGDHTDYNGGRVLPCALGRGIYSAIRPRSDRRIRLLSAAINDKDIIETSLDEADRWESLTALWSRHILGAIQVLREDGFAPPCGFDLYVDGDLPMELGLASSSALEVLAVMSLGAIWERELEAMEIVQLAKRIKNEVILFQGGIMDPFACVFGRKDHAICLSVKNMHYRHIALKAQDVCLVITNSLVHHELGSISYRRRQRECQRALKKINQMLAANYLCDISTEQFETYKDFISDPILRKRVRHVVYENERVIRAVNALLVDHLSRFGELMYESHASLKNNYEVSCPSLDFLVECAKETDGVLGSRMSGGGFGGCTISLVKNTAVEGFESHVRQAYQERFGIEPRFYILGSGDGASELI